MALCPKVRLGLIVDAPSDGMFINLDEACEAYPDTPINDEWLGTPMLYSSGTTGRPKGVLRPLPDNPPREPLSLFHFLAKLWRYREDMVYLSPAPPYHSAPQAAVSLCVRSGGTAIIMEHFDPEQYLALIEKYRVTHSQLVPTMFNRFQVARRCAPPLRPVVAGSRDSCRCAMPRADQGAHDRMVGPDRS